MAYQVLYRKYRPQRFEDVVGQEYIVKTLRNIINKNKVAHAYLFCGPRGTGKTSTAKIFAKAVNCQKANGPCDECVSCLAFKENNHPDIIEMDAASNNSVEDIRDLIERVAYAPVMGKYKVYIIDEVHMLSNSAFNALLKTLEEPPTNVIFILATTEPHKLLPTVLSRCQRFNFNRISKEAMKNRVIEILQSEAVEYEEKAVDLIVSLAKGGMRDVLSLLEQALAFGDYRLKTDDVMMMFGIMSPKELANLIINIKKGQSQAVMGELDNLYLKGIDLQRLLNDLIEINKKIIFYQEGINELLEDLSVEESNELSAAVSREECLRDIDLLIRAQNAAQSTRQELLPHLKLAFIKMMDRQKPSVAAAAKTKKTTVAKTVETHDEKIQPESGSDNIEKINNQEDIEFGLIDVSPEFLLSILSEAKKEYKEEDTKIYHRLFEYNNDVEKRKFFNMLKGGEIFASSPEAIIFKCPTALQKDNINDQKNNRELFDFLFEEFGIDKMVYAIDEKEMQDLSKLYINRRNQPIEKQPIIKYEHNKERSAESLLAEVFGKDKVRIEE